MQVTQDYNNRQLNLFSTNFSDYLNMSDPLCKLADKIDWNQMCQDLPELYSNLGRSAISFRTMVGLEAIKFIYNLSDRGVIDAFLHNPYIQYFCGNNVFSTEAPCDSTTLSNFRKRLGEEGYERIFKESFNIHGKELPKDVYLDTTVACKNIKYPTDNNLLSRAIDYCHRIAKEYNIKLKNTYKKELKKIMRTIRFEKNKKNTSECKKAHKRLHTIAGILIREIERKLDIENKEKLDELINILNQIYEQTKPKTLHNEAKKINNKIQELNQLFEQLISIAKKSNIEIEDNFCSERDALNNEYLELKGKNKRENMRKIESKILKLLKKLYEKIQNTNSDESNQDLTVIKSILEKWNKDKKIYSIHEPHVRAIAKGKDNVKYEYGAKVAVAVTSDNIIVGVASFSDNPHDSKTVRETLDSIKKSTSSEAEEAYADRGYRGSINIALPTKMHIPNCKNDNNEKKEILKEKFARRSAIEPIIGHLKNDHRLRRVYLKGIFGDKVNILMASAAFNFKKWCNNELKE